MAEEARQPLVRRNTLDTLNYRRLQTKLSHVQIYETGTENVNSQAQALYNVLNPHFNRGSILWTYL